MIQEIVGYACVALFTIGIMLLFCIDILKKSYTLIQLNTTETTTTKADAIEVKVEVVSIIHEKNLAYPFYVGYTHSTDKLSMTDDKSSN